MTKSQTSLRLSTESQQRKRRQKKRTSDIMIKLQGGIFRSKRKGTWRGRRSLYVAKRSLRGPERQFATFLEKRTRSNQKRDGKGRGKALCCPSGKRGKPRRRGQGLARKTPSSKPEHKPVVQSDHHAIREAKYAEVTS